MRYTMLIKTKSGSLIDGEVATEKSLKELEEALSDTTKHTLVIESHLDPGTLRYIPKTSIDYFEFKPLDRIKY